MSKVGTKVSMKLSPSRMKDYSQCPKLFYFKYILGYSTPVTPAIAKGTLAHYVFENIFDVPKGSRTEEYALSLVPVFWEIMKNPFKDINDVVHEVERSFRVANNLHLSEFSGENDEHKKIFESSKQYIDLFNDVKEESDFLAATNNAVLGWFKMENPNVFDPTSREEYVFAEFGKNIIHGYIDRFDRVISNDGTEKVYISDYKTGKVPPQKYADDAFFQLLVYALIHNLNTGEIPHRLRLLYVNEGNPSAVLVKDVEKKLLDKTKDKITSLSKSISDSLEKNSWPTKKQVLCDWCPFKNICPEFNPGVDGILSEEVDF